MGPPIGGSTSPYNRSLTVAARLWKTVTARLGKPVAAWLGEPVAGSVGSSRVVGHLAREKGTDTCFASTDFLNLSARSCREKGCLSRFSQTLSGSPGCGQGRLAGPSDDSVCEPPLGGSTFPYTAPSRSRLGCGNRSRLGWIITARLDHSRLGWIVTARWGEPVAARLGKPHGGRETKADHVCWMFTGIEPC